MVTYANSTWRVQILGQMFGGGEEWSTGFFMGNTSGGDVGQAPTTADCQAIATAWNTLFTTGANGFSNYFNTLGVKISLVSTAGTSDPSNTAYYYYPSSIYGGGSGAPYPPQIALVATLATAKVRGYGSKGRMYLPGIKFAVDGTGHISGSETTTLKTALVTFLNACNANITQDYEVVVNSALSAGIPGHPALMEPVTSVRVGNVFDTQRRRRNALQESYVTGALA